MIQKPKHLAYTLDFDLDVIKHVIENIDRYYYKKIEPKTNDDKTPKMKNGEPVNRILYPSKDLLKEIQVKIKDKILSKIPLLSHIHGGVTKKSNITNAKKHQGKKYFFCTDLQGFFPSVNHMYVYNMFINNSFSADVSHLLTLLTTYKGCLPQGTPTSPHLANLVFLPIDKVLLEFCKEKKIVYTRFVDDLSFSSQTDFKDKTPNIIQIICDNGYNISHKKTFYKVGPTLVTGIKVKNNCLDVRKDQRKKLVDNSISQKSKEGLSRYIQSVTNA